MNFITILGLASLALFTGQSHTAQSKQKYFYVKVGVGQMYQRSYLKYGDTYGLWAKAAPKSDIIPMIGLGYKATHHLLLDLELSYNRALYKYQDPGYPRRMFQKTEKTNLIANGYYKFKCKNHLSPYLMGGLGASYNNAHALHASYPPPRNTQSYDGTAKKFWSLAWNLGAGLKYNLAKRFTIDLGYRYMDYGTVKMNAPSSLGWGKGKEKLAGNLFILSGYYNIF